MAVKMALCRSPTVLVDNLVIKVSEQKACVMIFIIMVRAYDEQRRKRALMGRFSHFQFLTFFNR